MKYIRIGDYCPFNYGKGLPEQIRNPLGTIPVYGSNGIIGNHDVSLTNGPTIIIGRKGTIGTIHYSKNPCWPIDTTFFITKKDGMDLRFVYYLLKQLGLDHMNSDSAVPGLNRDTAHDIQIQIPSLQQQNRIASKLEIIDDMMTSIKEQIAILDRIVLTIFKSWFIDFHGQTDFVDSELGLIPREWRVEKFSKFIELLYGKSLTARDRNKGHVPVFGSSGVIGYHDEAIVTGPGIIVGRKGNVGSVFWSDSDFYPIDTVYYVKSQIPFEFVYCLLKTLNFINSDSSVPGLSREQAYSLLILIPHVSLLQKFSKIVNFFFRLKTINEKRVQVLTKIHDLLLPKLMSGEIRV